MIKVFFLIFEPAVAWEKIGVARRGYAFILATYLLPFILLVTALEGWGLQHWGKWQPKFQVIRSFSHSAIVTYETIQFLLLLAMVLVSALLILRISQTFHTRTSYLQTFTLAAYGFSPVFLLHLLDAAPMMNPWVTWALGSGLTVWILYQGIPRVLLPDPTHAFGLYLSSIFVTVVVSGMARLITSMYLLGYMDFHHSWLTRELANWLPH